MSPVVVRHPTHARLRSDDELVAATRAGSDDAYALLVARHRLALTGYARAVLGGAHHDAEEAVQDAFVRALQALRREPGRTIHLRAWLHAIVRNACLDRLRRPGRTVDLGALEGVLGDERADPARALERSEELAALVGEIGRLPDRQRRALVGFALEGRSHEELAAQLDVTVSASKALVHRARHGLAAAAAAA